MNKVNFITDCPCKFIINDTGIFSIVEVPVKEMRSSVSGTTTTCEVFCEGTSPSVVMGMQNVTVGGNIVIGGNVISTNSIHTDSPQHTDTQKVRYEHYWKAEAPFLQKVDISGTANVDLLLPLAPKFKMTASGGSVVNIYHEYCNYNQKFTAKTSGDASLYADSIVLNDFNVTMSGNSRVSGIGVRSSLRAKLSGNSLLFLEKFLSVPFNSANIVMSGNSKLNGRNCEVNNINVSTSGAAYCANFIVHSRLFAEASDNSKISLTTESKCIIKKFTSGFGKIFH